MSSPQKNPKRKCSIDGCEKYVVCKGYCGPHYWRSWLHGDPLWKSPIWHGGVGTPEYGAWEKMKVRCRDKKGRWHKYYRARGITFCKRWNSFSAFLEDMGPKPSPKHELDRIDNDGNYEPKNCRWATRREQMRNTRTARFVLVNRKKMSLLEAAEHFGITKSGIQFRIKSGTLKEIPR